MDRVACVRASVLDRFSHKKYKKTRNNFAYSILIVGHSLNFSFWKWLGD